MPTVTMPLTGRWGNLLFQAAFMYAFGEQHGYTVSLPPWVGEKVFNLPFSPRPDQYKPDLVLPEDTLQYQDALIYTRKQVKQWFKFRPEVEEKLREVPIPEALILNVREGEDYKRAGLVRITRQSYLDAAVRYGYSPRNTDFETDNTHVSHPYFIGDIDASGLCTTWVGLPSFWRLMNAPVLFRANSSFSWWAATLGNGKVYSPIIRGMEGGEPRYCPEFVDGNWPIMACAGANTDLHLRDE